MQKKEEEIRELQAMANNLLQDKALLQAQVNESDYWIYDRGPVAEEMQQLRQQSALQIQEVNRLTLENTRVMDDLRRAEAIVAGAGRRYPQHQPGHPLAERPSITQTYINQMWSQARQQGRRNNEPLL